MSDVLAVGFFTLAGVALGSYGSYRLFVHSRKEKFKEIIYKEQLAVYKELAFKLFAVEGGVLCYMAGDPKDGAQRKELRTKALGFLFFMMKQRLILPDNVFNSRGNPFQLDSRKPRPSGGQDL